MTDPKDKSDGAYDDPRDIPLDHPDWAEGVRSRLLARAAELRREVARASGALVEDDVVLQPARPIRPDYLAMDRIALISVIEDMSRRIGPVQVAHRNLHELSDNDLRRLLETIAEEPE